MWLAGGRGVKGRLWLWLGVVDGWWRGEEGAEEGEGVQEGGELAGGGGGLGLGGADGGVCWLWGF